jgi:RimJ/RimL family protein N-acetyltransferase
MILETDRLALRLENQGDLEPLYEMMRDPYTMCFSPRPSPSDEVKGVIEQHIADDREHGFGLWALLLKKDSVFIGQCGISIRHLDGEPVPKIGYQSITATGITAIPPKRQKEVYHTDSKR